MLHQNSNKKQYFFYQDCCLFLHCCHNCQTNCVVFACSSEFSCTSDYVAKYASVLILYTHSRINSTCITLTSFAQHRFIDCLVLVFGIQFGFCFYGYVHYIFNVVISRKTNLSRDFYRHFFGLF